MRWTEDQLRAIETRKKNLLVSAAAGSGKTALLIERIRRIVWRKRPVWMPCWCLPLRGPRQRK